MAVIGSRLLLVCLTCVLVCSALAAVLLGIASGLLHVVFQKILEKKISEVRTVAAASSGIRML